MSYIKLNGQEVELSEVTEYVDLTNLSKIEIQLQDGPVKENGVNGCQIDDVIEMSKNIIESFNKRFPCRENSCVITKLDEAILWLMKRKQDRENRKVEGLNLK